MIAVTAAGGVTGTAVVRALMARGKRVRAVVPSRRPRPALDALGAEVVVGDLTGDLTAALTGAEALYLIWPNFDPAEATGAPAVLAAAAHAGVPRLVYHSVLRPQTRAMPHHAAKDRVEEALDGAVAGTAARWRVLQPCAYADNLDGQLPGAVETGELRSPWGLEQAQSFVDLRDVAEAAAVLVTEDGLDSGTFEAAGPEALTAPDVAALLSRHSARPVTAVDVAAMDDGTYAGRCRTAMFDWYRAHGFAGSPRVLTTLLGRPPRTVAEHLETI
ncbi:SDR family oxidoreductase [Blastococcus saxobsidens]|uniref:Putative nucleoside-diphosphate-sugar epimerase n=1 Tax=Blastococcus saxobsidens (strain DD2) TaxID=1146883 RepID=H6RQQ7_BLASD|nr:NmrA family NAD(P)-binding protein [Blastococcus saxobsidens]CCG01584.1 putative nucleoside-diphosphate-sugar epimerase [Blastococcus saxobsidens DD2]